MLLASWILVVNGTSYTRCCSPTLLVRGAFPRTSKRRTTHQYSHHQTTDLQTMFHISILQIIIFHPIFHPIFHFIFHFIFHPTHVAGTA